MLALNTSAFVLWAWTSISATGPSPRISSGLSTTNPSWYSPGRTRMRSPGRAALMAAPMVAKSPRWKASTTWVGGSDLAAGLAVAACSLVVALVAVTEVVTCRTSLRLAGGCCQKVLRILLPAAPASCEPPVR
jgi:hypothetical protein